MESAEFWQRNDLATSVYGLPKRRVFGQPPMGPIDIVVICVLLKQAAQIGLAEHDDMVGQFSPVDPMARST